MTIPNDTCLLYILISSLHTFSDDIVDCDSDNYIPTKILPYYSACRIGVIDIDDVEHLVCLPFHDIIAPRDETFCLCNNDNIIFC